MSWYKLNQSRSAILIMCGNIPPRDGERRTRGRLSGSDDVTPFSEDISSKIDEIPKLSHQFIFLTTSP